MVKWGINMQTKIFQSGNSQAVRLPKNVAFPKEVTKVNVIVQGCSRIITPSEQTWDNWFNNKNITDDFMEKRDQPDMQERDAF